MVEFPASLYRDSLQGRIIDCKNSRHGILDVTHWSVDSHFEASSLAIHLVFLQPDVAFFDKSVIYGCNGAVLS